MNALNSIIKVVTPRTIEESSEEVESTVGKTAQITNFKSKSKNITLSKYEDGSALEFRDSKLTLVLEDIPPEDTTFDWGRLKNDIQNYGLRNMSMNTRLPLLIG